MSFRLNTMTWKRASWLDVYKQVHEDRELNLCKEATRIRDSVQNQNSVLICSPDQKPHGIYLFIFR